MNKAALVERIAAETGVTKSDTKLMVDAITNAIIAELMDGGQVTLPGLGTLYVGATKEHEGFDPATGRMREIPRKKQVRFKAAADLKRKMNG